MSWFSIHEYADKTGLAPNFIQELIAIGRLKARKFDRRWFIQVDDEKSEKTPEPDMSEPELFAESAVVSSPLSNFSSDPSQTSIDSVVSFSSKALHHYLILSEKLIAEKDIRLREKDSELSEKRQSVADLESYVKLLEAEIEK